MQTNRFPVIVQRHGRCSSGVEQSDFPKREERAVTRRPSLLPAEQSEPVGIVIRAGASTAKPVRFWAYLWAADDEDAMDQHWHQRVPAEHAA